MRRRDFIAGLGSTAAWPVVAGAQTPVIGFLDSGSPEGSADFVAAFRKGLGETGYAEGRNVTIEFRYALREVDRMPELAADLVRRRVAVIATPGSTPASLAAKAATTTIPIVFSVCQDPVKLGLVTSLAQPGGNATGINFFASEVVAKRLGLLHQLMPKANRVAVIVNPANTTGTEATLRGMQDYAGRIGLPIDVLKASTIREIDAAFATMVRERPDALFVTGDSFYTSRRVQFATLAARDRIPAAYSVREFVVAGGLMSYGSEFAGRYRQVGVYTGNILKGAKPADYADFDFANSPGMDSVGPHSGAFPTRRRATNIATAELAEHLGYSSLDGRHTRRCQRRIPSRADDFCRGGLKRDPITRNEGDIRTPVSYRSCRRSEPCPAAAAENASASSLRDWRGIGSDCLRPQPHGTL
jgi:putative tryptophan/tyrosine transport system substrate-binding protein